MKAELMLPSADEENGSTRTFVALFVLHPGRQGACAWSAVAHRRLYCCWAPRRRLHTASTQCVPATYPLCWETNPCQHTTARSRSSCCVTITAVKAHTGRRRVDAGCCWCVMLMTGQGAHWPGCSSTPAAGRRSLRWRLSQRQCGPVVVDQPPQHHHQQAPPAPRLENEDRSRIWRRVLCEPHGALVEAGWARGRVGMTMCCR